MRSGVVCETLPKTPTATGTSEGPGAGYGFVRRAAAGCQPDWHTGDVHSLITIVSAGPAGLALARELQRLGLRPTLLERSSVGETWARHYRGLRLHALATSARLRGMAWPTPRPRFPSGRVPGFPLAHARGLRSRRAGEDDGPVGRTTTCKRSSLA